MVEASGRLAYDAYGNLDLSGKINDPAAAGGSAPALNFKGRAVVDAGASRIVLADVEGNVDPSALPKNMGIDKVRYYSFEGDTLSLETRDGIAGPRTYRLEANPLVRRPPHRGLSRPASPRV